MVLSRFNNLSPSTFSLNSQDINTPSVNSDASDLLSYANDQQRRGNLEEAMGIYAQLAEGGEENTPGPIRQRAQVLLDAIQGVGGFTAARAEFLGDTFMEQVFDPAALGSMVGAGLTYKVARFGLLGSAARLGMRSRWVRPAATLLAFGAEASLFPIYGRLGNMALGREADWGSEQLIHDIQGSFLVLGGLKLFGAMGNQSLRWALQGGRPGSGLAQRVLPTLIPQTAMYLGILSGHQAEQALGLTEATSTGQLLTESLVTLLHFNAMGRLIPLMGGPRVRSLEQRLEFESHRIGDGGNGGRRGKWFDSFQEGLFELIPGSRESLAGVGFQSKVPGPRAPVLGPSILMMENNGDRGGGRRRSTGSWKPDRETLQNAIQFILDHHLDGNPTRISASRYFTTRRFQLEDGTEITGNQILRRVAGLEYPEKTLAQAVETMGGNTPIARFLRSHYLGRTPWDSDFDSLKGHIQYIFREYLEENPSYITGGASFTKRTFRLTTGAEITGFQVINAVARLEMPEIRYNRDAVDELGGRSGVADVIRRKYLAAPPWDDSPQRLRLNLQYILENYFEGDSSRFVGSNEFKRRQFLLPDNTEVSGHQVLYAVARFESPHSLPGRALNDFKSSRTVRVLRSKYLANPPWYSTPESFQRTMRYVLRHHFDGNYENFHSGIRKGNFEIEDGTSVSGDRILRAVARFERPEISTIREAVKILGGFGATARLLRNRYLGLEPWDLNAERVRETIQNIYEDSFRRNPQEFTTMGVEGKSFRLRDGAIISGNRLLEQYAQSVRPDAPPHSAIRTMGGKVATINHIRENVLGIERLVAKPRKRALSERSRGQRTRPAKRHPQKPVQRQKPRNALPSQPNPAEIIAATLANLESNAQFILRTQMEGNLNKITSYTNFSGQRFRLADGTEVRGQALLRDFVRIKRPGMTIPQAVRELGGRAQVFELFRREMFQQSSWDTSSQNLRRTIRYIVENYLSGNPRRISSGPAFTAQRYRLSDGTEISGTRLLSAVASLERPNLNTGDATRQLGGVGAVADLLRDKYYGHVVWDSSVESFRESIQYIVDHYLEGDPRRIAAHKDFFRGNFLLPGGNTVTGVQIISAAARLERPGLRTSEARVALGNDAGVVRLIRRKYLDHFRWDRNEESVREALQYVLENYLDNKPYEFRHHPEFHQRVFDLPDGTRIRGRQFLTAVAHLEKPELKALEALRVMGGAEIFRRIRTKYLNYVPWHQSFETIQETLHHIISRYYDDFSIQNETMVNFNQRRFQLPNGLEISGFQLNNAVAKIENPHRTVRESVRGLGGHLAVHRILLRKYVGLVDLQTSGPLRGGRRTTGASGSGMIPPREVISLILDFSPNSPMTEADIRRIVRAIVEQDNEMHPGGDGSTLTGTEAKFKRRYRVEGEELNLGILTSRIRRARGLKGNDRQALSNATLLEEWRRRIFGLESVLPERLVVPLVLDFTPRSSMTEGDIRRIVRAIVEQDVEMYSGGDGNALSSHGAKMRRRYQVGGKEVSLSLLANRVRQARGLRANDKKTLSNGTIVGEWRRKIFGLEPLRRERVVVPLSLDFTPESPMTEMDVRRIVRAIVEQDAEMYPGGDGRALSSNHAKLGRRYQVGGEELSLRILMYRHRRARGLKGTDRRALSNSAIVEEWGREIFRLEPAIQGIPLTLNFTPSRPMSEVDIRRIVRAIVEQDAQVYPGGDGRFLTTTHTKFERRYRIGGEELNFRILASRTRQARGLKGKDSQALSNATIVEEWRREIFGIETVVREEVEVPITLDFTPGSPMTEVDIHRIVRAIVEQDAEMYPGGDGSALSSSKAKFGRRYQVGGEEFRLRTLAYWIRRARGLKGNDHQTLSNTTIVEEWRRDIFGIQNFANSRSTIEAFIQRTGIRQIVDLFHDEPGQLIEALNCLKRNEFRHQDVREFVRAYVGLRVIRETGVGEYSRPGDSWERRRAYILGIVRALEAGEDLDLSESSFRSQLSLLIRLSRRSFEENPNLLIEELGTQATEFPHPFLQRLHTEAANYFREAQGFSVEGMRSLPYGYQREGAHFLATHDRAILADEAGLGKTYQVIATAEHLGLNRVLWVTTASNKETLREEILTHSITPIEGVEVVISGDPRERRRQIQNLGAERYRIINYETLVALERSDPGAYATLTRDLDAVVVDEAQLADNAQALRSQAVRQITSPRRWLVTATPYQNRPENIWSLLNWLNPDQYPDFRAFQQVYTQSTEGLLLLHSELNDLMLRRTKRDTLSFFEDSQQTSFAEQLSGGIPRLPRKVRLLPETSGAFSLSAEQADLIAWMTADFRDWAQHFNAHLPNGAEPVSLDNLNPLVKFQTIHRVIYQPEHFGLESFNPLFEATDRIVARRLNRGEKLILWAWNTAMIDALVERYESYGVRRIDGQVLGAARDRARHDFQDNPGVRLLVANYQSGGVGLTLTAAHAALFTQLPSHFPMLYQAEGRHHRLIGPQNLRHAKERVEVEWLVPTFPEGFVENLTDPRLAEILSHGSLVEQTRARLEGGEVLYNLMMEGYGRQEDLDQHFRAGLIRGMGLDGAEPLNYISHLKGQVRDYARVTQSLMPLWGILAGEPAAEEGVLRLIELYRNYPAQAERLGRAIGESSRAYPEDLEFFASLFEIRNKFIRSQILARVPDLISRIYSQGQSLYEVMGDNQGEVLNPATFLAQLFMENNPESGQITQIARDLSGLRDTPQRRYLEEHLFMGVFGIMGNAHAEALLTRSANLWEGQSVTNRIHLLYRLGLVTRLRSDLVEEFNQNNFSEWPDFFRGVERVTQRVLGEWAGGSAEQVEAMVQANPNWRGNADPLLALLAGYEAQGDRELLEQYREALGHLLEGDYAEWRGGNERLQGNPIDYLSENQEFWQAMSQTTPTIIDHLSVEPQLVRMDLLRDYQNLLLEVGETGPAVEGSWVMENFQRFREASATEQSETLRQFQKEVRHLGPLVGGQEVTPQAREILEQYTLVEPVDLASRAALQEKLTEIRNLISWMNLELGFREMLGPDRSARQTLENTDPSPFQGNLFQEVRSRARFYRGRKYDETADHFEALRDGLESYRSQVLQFRNITIEDTDDPAILARMGALHPELINCFNPNGNPTFNQFVVSALGSRNMRMILVREMDRIVAAAMVKVKQSEDGSPVLFLENGLYRRSYNFRREMLQHLATRAQGMVPRPRVMDQVRGRLRDSDPWVQGTGAFTESEYVEPVFGLRRATSVRHRGRVFVMPSETRNGQLELLPQSRERTSPRREEAPDSPPITLREGVGVLGFGTSNRSWEDYVRGLREQGVRVLVDVRAWPQSRYRPHFNRRRMEQALRQEGIEYVWLGDRLGNPQDAQGRRTMQGFQRYMQTPNYREGMGQLREILDRAEGNVALTCAEGRECDCHRKFILEDLRRNS